MADIERVYVIEGEDYPSVTTILGASIAKQSFLIPWAIKGYHQQASEWIQRNKAWGFHHSIDAVIDALNVDETRDALMEARDKEGYKPARIGNVVHHIISQSIHAAWDGNSKLIESVLAELDSPTTSNMGNELREMFADEGLVLDSGSDHRSVSSCLSAWQQWLKDFGVSANTWPATDTGQRFNICETEKLVYCKDDSSDPLYAGTVDLMLLDTKQPNRRFIIDIKTGTLNDEVMYQVAAYANAYNAISNSQHWFMDGSVEVPGIFRCFILQLRKTKGRYALKEAKNWYSLYSSGFAKANEWYISQREHTPGKQIKPADFIDGR